MSPFRYNTKPLARRAAELGLTQAELARRAGVSAGTISNVMAGRGGKGKTIGLIAGVLGLSLGKLVIPSTERPPRRSA
jgi:transcriptional regulator with XRE-family HTH domain